MSEPDDVPILTPEQVLDALDRSAEGANEMIALLEESLVLHSESARLVLR